MRQTHLYLVTPPEHQPAWPVNDNERDYQLRKIDFVVPCFCVLIVLGLAAGATWSTLNLLGLV